MFRSKYVGKQYYDNTSSDERSIPSYFVAGLSMAYELPLKKRQDYVGHNAVLSLSLHVNNLFNNMYYADAWLWRAYFRQEDAYYSETGIYPQAPANVMFKLGISF